MNNQRYNAATCKRQNVAWLDSPTRQRSTTHLQASHRIFSSKESLYLGMVNPIEHLWEHIERKISVWKPSNQYDFFELIKRIWEEIPIDVLINLVDSMPHRCNAVIAAKGFPTKY